MSFVQKFRKILRQIERDMVVHLKVESRCCGVTLAQCHVLLELTEHQEVGLAILAEKLRLDPSTMSRSIDGLVKEGFVSRDENPENRRAVILRLSPEGMEKAEAINNSCDGFYKNLLNKVSKERKKSLLEGMEILAEVLAKETAQADCCGSARVKGKKT